MITCIAIDDEPLALRQIVAYIEKTPYLELKKQFSNAIPAINYLLEHDIDLMFVDINMPDLSGLDFVKSLKNPPKVVFTTAHSEFAVEGFRVDALDYLLKPIGYNDFIEATNRAKNYFDKDESTQIKSSRDFLLIKSEYKIVKVNFNDIKYIEAMQEYVKIHLINQSPLMTLSSMKKILQALPEANFMRVHRSFIVNLNKITVIERNRIIFDNNVYIPVSEQYKAEFQKFLDENFLI